MTLSKTGHASLKDTACPNAKNHTPHPDGYLQHAAWAEEKMKTHKQIKCPECGLWAIWVKK